MRTYVLKNGINLLLALITVSMVVFVVLLLNSHYKLHHNNPLDNFSGRIITPVDLAKNTTLDTAGTFDRNIACELLNFKVFLTNQDTNDIIVLTPSHLVKAPTTNIYPGKDISVNFSLKIPNTLTVGTWMPEFVGQYLCSSGIFQALKTQVVLTSAFNVIDSSIKN